MKCNKRLSFLYPICVHTLYNVVRFGRDEEEGMKRWIRTWKVPGLELENVEDGNDTVQFVSVSLELVAEIERNQLFFRWVESVSRWHFFHCRGWINCSYVMYLVFGFVAW